MGTIVYLMSAILWIDREQNFHFILKVTNTLHGTFIDLKIVFTCRVPGLLVAWMGGPGDLRVPPCPHRLLLPLLLHLLRSLRRQAQGPNI